MVSLGLGLPRLFPEIVSVQSELLVLTTTLAPLITGAANAELPVSANSTAVAMVKERMGPPFGCLAQALSPISTSRS